MDPIPTGDQIGLKSQVAKGAAWTITVRLTLSMLAVLSQLVLARLLVPEDFGLVALAGSVSAFLEVMSRLGFSTVLIQKQTTDRAYYDTAWTLTLLTAVLIAIVLCLLARPAAIFFADQRIEDIVFVLAGVALLRGFTNIGIVAFQKEMQFQREFVYFVIQKLVSLSVTLPLAFWMRSYWALVIGIAAFWLAGVLLSYMMHPFRPRFGLTHTAEIFRFSRWLLANNVISWLGRQGIPVFVGRISGISGAGLYSMASQFASIATRELTSPINRAVYPGFAKVSSDRERLARGYLLSLGAVALVVSPVAAGLASVSEPLVYFALGDKWSGIIPVLYVLCLSGLLDVLHGNAHSVYFAVARPEIAPRVQLLRTTLTIGLLIPGLYYLGLEVAIWALFIAQLISMIVAYATVSQLLPIGVLDCLKSVGVPVVASVLMIAGVTMADSILRDVLATSLFVRLTSDVAVGGTIYVAIVYGCWFIRGFPDGPERELLDLTRKAVRAIRKRGHQGGELPDR